MCRYKRREKETIGFVKENQEGESMMKKKRLWAWALTAAMAVGAVPMTATAADAETTETRRISVCTEEQNPIQMTKSVNDADNTITMEAYVTNEVTMQDTSKPMDIVLVLDVSGSMKEALDKNNKSKMEALQDAVNTFIGSVAEDAKKNEAEHRIGIVKFAGERSDAVGNETYRDGGYSYNYSQVVKELTPVKEEADRQDLKDAVNALKPAGATRADEGVALAQNIFEKEKDTETGKAVILFTDGEPTRFSRFDYKVAADAVTTAEAMKNNGVKIFTIGMFDEAITGDKDLKKNIEDYMNAVSSNYPKATAKVRGDWDWDWNLNLGDRAKGDYYFTADSADGLTEVFQTVREGISTLTVKADENAILADTLTENFIFGENVGEDGSGVTVKKAPVLGKTADGYIWGEPEEVENISIKVDKKARKIEITGFDYTAKENAVTETKDGQDVTYSGYKLVLRFPITPDTAANWKKGKHLYETNTTAGLENIQKNNEAAEEYLPESPQVPMEAYGVTYDADGGENAPTDEKGYLYDTKATVKGKENMTKSGYTFAGWKDAFGKDWKEADTITMTGDVTLTAQWTEDETPIPPTEKVQYKVEHYLENANGGYDLKDFEFLDGEISKQVSGKPKEYSGYAYDSVVSAETASGTVTKPTKSEAGETENMLVLKLYYGIDEKGGDNGGDNIPDKYQKKVTFKVVNGTWADDTTADRIAYVTLVDANGNWSKDGSGALTAPVGMKANTNYSSGKWDAIPPTTVSGTEDVTYTYSFSRTTGGGGGGGSHSNRNTAKNEPKQEEVLNKEDHFQYVQGYPDATVRPDANITRAEATVIFFRLLTDSVREKYLDTENSFTDVNAADWYNLGISTMENGGFVNGYQDGSFRPNGYITRAELATIISNFDDLEPVEESKFPDAAGHWAEAYINSAAEKGWLSGYADGLFRPNQLITRAETMSMINRVLNRSVDADGLHKDAKQWQDNPIGKWYYYAVLEATNPHVYERKDTADLERWTAITDEKIWEN